MPCRNMWCLSTIDQAQSGVPGGRAAPKCLAMSGRTCILDAWLERWVKSYQHMTGGVNIQQWRMDGL